MLVPWKLAWYEGCKKYPSGISLGEVGDVQLLDMNRKKSYQVLLSLENKMQQNPIFGGHQGEKEDATKPF